MATLNVQVVTNTGLVNPTLAAADVGGDAFPNTGRQYVEVKNDDASQKTVTVKTHQTVDGIPVQDVDVVVPAGQRALIGPFGTNLFNDPSGDVLLSYDAVTSVTVGVFEVPTQT